MGLGCVGLTKVFHPFAPFHSTSTPNSAVLPPESCISPSAQSTQGLSLSLSKVEDGVFDTMTVTGQGYLADSGLNATGAVITMAWGKQMSELGYVHHHDGNTLRFNRIWCPQMQAPDSSGPSGMGNLPPYQRSPPYGSCSSSPFLKIKDGVEQGMASYWLGGKIDFINQDKVRENEAGVVLLRFFITGFK